MNREAEFARQAVLLNNSYHHWTGRWLVQPSNDEVACYAALNQMTFALVSHNLADDPCFNFSNQAALALFKMKQEAFIGMPSRFSAAPVAREERARLLERVSQHGIIEDYCGVRIAGNGDRFNIINASVWNVLDEDGHYAGQAAMIPEWAPLSG